MELSRGVCILCQTTNTKVVVPPQAGDITSLLCEIIKDFIDNNKFQETTNTLKVCPNCLHDIIQVHKQGQNIKHFSDDSTKCCLCHESDNLVSIPDWTHLDTLLENINIKKGRQCSACVNCIHYLHKLESLKVNFLRKYPHLTKKQSAKKEPLSIQPSRRLSKSHTSNHKLSALGKSLRKLNPLKYSKFNMDPYKDDKKLLQQIAFVKLIQGDLTEALFKSPKSSDDNETSPNGSNSKSFFKIKLKTGNKSSNRGKIQRGSAGRVQKPKQTRTYISLGIKELLVRIPKADLKVLQGSYNKRFNHSNSSSPSNTPTKASRKMMPDETLNSSKRKSVTFNETLNQIINDGDSIENDSDPFSTPKKSRVDALEIGDDPLRTENTESNELDSDEELEPKKSYVEEIKENNDSIFDSLKSTPARKITNGTRTYEGESGIGEDLLSNSNVEKGKADEAEREGSPDIISTDDERVSLFGNSESDPDIRVPKSKKSLEEVLKTDETAKILLQDPEEDFLVTLTDYKKLNRLSGSEKTPSGLKRKRRFSHVGEDQSEEEPPNKVVKVSEDNVKSNNCSDNVSEPIDLPNKETNVVSNDPLSDNTLSDGKIGDQVRDESVKSISEVVREEEESFVDKTEFVADSLEKVEENV